MRIDKYLKVSRLIKRRTVANQACDAGRVSVNGRPVRASYEVKIDDELSISFGGKSIKVQITEISGHVSKDSASLMYKIIE